VKTEDGRELGARRFQHWLNTGEDELPEDVPDYDGPAVQLSLLGLLDEPDDS
jgi:hypothetical protein